MDKESIVAKGLSSKEIEDLEATCHIKVISEAEGKAQRDQYKKEHQLFDYNELDQLAYPGYVIAFLNYFATGEGMTRGVLITHVHRPEQLREQLVQAWGSYFAEGCEARNGVTPLPRYVSLIPVHAHSIIEKIKSRVDAPGGFSYSCLLHANYS